MAAQSIIEVLSSNGPTFTVDTAANQVILATASQTLMQVTTGYSLFKNKDNLTLYEIGLELPYQYCNGEGPVSYTLGWKNESDLNFIEVYAGYLPSAQKSVSLVQANGQGLFIPNPFGQPGFTSDRAYLVAAVAGNVSMIYNPPAIANGTVLNAWLWAKIGHLFPLEAA